MLYVAYGSNMNLEQMKYRCPNSKLIGTGTINGWELVFNIHADIIETNNPEDSLPVVVWDISDEDWFYLDMYEGYPRYYVKREVPVNINNGDFDYAVVYVMNDARKGVCPPYEDYFDSIVSGCFDNGIDTEYLYDALNFSYDNETERNQYTV